MRRIPFALWLAVLLGCRSALAFELPDKVYRLANLDKAKAEALTKGKPLTFVYTDRNSSGYYFRRIALASLNTMIQMKKVSVVVCVDTDTERTQLPTVVQDALNSPDVGMDLPKTFVVDAQMEKLIAVIPAALGKDLDDQVREVRKKIAKAMPAAGASGGSEPTAAAGKATVGGDLEPDENRMARTWKSKSGAETRAALVKETGTYLVLKKDDGSHVQIPFNALSDQDQQYVLELKAGQRKSE